MTDLEMTRLCAEAMGLARTVVEHRIIHNGTKEEIGVALSRFDPLNNDAQVMALVKKFHLLIDWPQAMLGQKQDVNARATKHEADQLGMVVGQTYAVAETLNRAVVECVAKWQKAKGVANG